MPGGERLGQDHAEALAGERGRAEHVGLAQSSPRAPRRETRPRASIMRIDLGVGEVARRPPRRSAPITVSRAGHVLDQRLEGGEQDRQALALLGAADEERSAARSPAGFGPVRRGGDVDAVGDDLVVAAEPAARRSRRPPRRRRSGRQSWLKMRRAPSSDGDLVRQRLGRVGVEGADDGRAADRQASQPISGAGGSWTWTTSGANERSSRRILVTPSGKSADVGDGAVGAESRPCGRAGPGSRAPRRASGAARCRRRGSGGRAGPRARARGPRDRAR